MTQPISDDDDVIPPESGARPDWLLDPDEHPGQVSPLAATPRQASRPPAPAPPVERAPNRPEHRMSDRAEGLVRPATPDVPLPAQSSEWEHRGYEPNSLHATAQSSRTTPSSEHAKPSTPRTEVTTPAAPGEHSATSASREDSVAKVTGAAWTAAASSIPSLRGMRRRAVVTDDPAPADPWENEPFIVPRPIAAEPATPVAVTSRSDFVASTLKQLARLPLPVYAVAAGVLVAVVVAVVMIQPKEEFTSIRHIKTHAREMDGRLVHIRGTVGQSFPVGGGFAFYLHQKRDTIVVFTRNGTPVERKHIKLMGTVSTGFLDGAARAAIFEAPPTPS